MTTTWDDRPAALADQLRWVHAMLRRDLAAVRHLAGAVADGAVAADVRSELTELGSRGPLFQLRTTCLGYCQILHSHHDGESDVLFPAVGAAAPHLRDAVDRLEAEHQAVSDLLAEIETLTDRLEREASRRDLVDALTRLSTALLDHLEYEEATIGPILDEWDEWPDPPG